jgi:hypothetical protein
MAASHQQFAKICEKHIPTDWLTACFGGGQYAYKIYLYIKIISFKSNTLLMNAKVRSDQ